MSYDIGFLGGGQLARMSIHAAQQMGLRCVSLDSGENTPASQVADAHMGALDDPDAIRRILDTAERVTLENEFIPAAAIVEALHRAGRGPACVIPGVSSLATIQDKLLQRRAYEAAGVASPHAVPLEGDAEQARAEIGFPMVLKARFGGYDGKGTRYARTEEQLESHRDLWGGGGWLAEAFVPFRRELAVMVVRQGDREVAFRTVETIQTHHVCDLVFPCDADASSVARAAVAAVGGQGLFGVELFEREDGAIVVNEIAPRPHNSGHYTLDGWSLSQFQAHVLAVLGIPVPEPMEFAPSIMANLLGQPGAGDFRAGLRALDPAVARLHWYGKESRPGRKMGHINVVGADLGTAREQRERFYRAWTGVH